jgi:hypothetical protein
MKAVRDHCQSCSSEYQVDTLPPQETKPARCDHNLRGVFSHDFQERLNGRPMEQSWPEVSRQWLLSRSTDVPTAVWGVEAQDIIEIQEQSRAHYEKL